jgi:hypothetical protein
MIIGEQHPRISELQLKASRKKMKEKRSNKGKNKKNNKC